MNHGQNQPQCWFLTPLIGRSGLRCPKRKVVLHLLVLLCFVWYRGRAEFPGQRVKLLSKKSSLSLDPQSKGCLEEIAGIGDGERSWCGETNAGPHQHPILATMISVSFLVGIIIFILVWMS